MSDTNELRAVKLTETVPELIKRMRGQAWHLDGTWAEEFPNGELMMAGADALERAVEALEVAREALERSYNVTTYPGDGTSRQDAAIATIDAALLSTSDARAPSVEEGKHG